MKAKTNKLVQYPLKLRKKLSHLSNSHMFCRRNATSKTNWNRRKCQHSTFYSLVQSEMKKKKRSDIFASKMFHILSGKCLRMYEVQKHWDVIKGQGVLEIENKNFPHCNFMLQFWSLRGLFDSDKNTHVMFLKHSE